MFKKEMKGTKMWKTVLYKPENNRWVYNLRIWFLKKYTQLYIYLFSSIKCSSNT